MDKPEVPDKVADLFSLFSQFAPAAGQPAGTKRPAGKPGDVLPASAEDSERIDKRAEAIYSRLRSTLVDINETEVCPEDEGMTTKGIAYVMATAQLLASTIVAHMEMLGPVSLATRVEVMHQAINCAQQALVGVLSMQIPPILMRPEQKPE